MRAARRRSVRIVDVSCGGGDVLLGVARLARAMGFLAVEVRGVDGDGAKIDRARRAADAGADRGIGYAFEQADARTILEEEADFPADLLLCDAVQARDSALMRIARRAARAVIGGRAVPVGRAAA